MTDKEVAIRFSADTSKLNASVASAEKTLDGMSATAVQASGGLNTINTTMKSVDTSSTSYSSTIRDAAQTTLALTQIVAAVVDVGGSFLARLRDIAVIGASTVYVTKEVGGGLLYVAETATEAGYALASLAVSGVATVLEDEAQAILDVRGALVGYFTGAAYAQRGAEMFTVANDGMRASIGRAIISTGEFLNFPGRIATAFENAYNSLRLFDSDLAKSEVTAIAAAGGLKQFGDALVAAGNVGAKETLTNFTLELEKIPETSDVAAQAIVAMLTSIPNYSVASTNTLIQFLQTFTKTGEEAQKSAKEISDAFKDPINGGKTLGGIASTIQNMDALVAVTKQWAASLSPDQATAMFDVVKKSLNDQKESIQFIDKQNDDQLAKVRLLGPAYQFLVDTLLGEREQHRQKIEAIERENALLEVQRQSQVALTAEQKQQAEFRAAMDAAKTPTSTIGDAEERRSNLQKNSRRDPDDVSDAQDKQGMLKTLSDEDIAIRVAILEAAGETDRGVLAVLNVMKNRVNASYGDYGNTLGDVVKKPGAFSAYDPAKVASIDPNSFQYRRVAQLADKTFGDNPDDDPTNGATHYYNPSLASPSWEQTMGNAQSIGNHRFGNADGAPVSSDDDEKTRREAIAQTNTEIREQNALREGGTEEEKQAADIAQSNLTNAKDAVDEAQKLVDVRQKAVTASKDGTPQEQAKANAALVQAQQALLDQEASRDKAANALKAAQAKEGSKERLDIQTAELNAEQTKYEEGSAKYLEIEKQKLELVKAYSAQQAAVATEAENAKFDAADRGFKQEQDLIKEQAKTRGLTYEQEEAQLIASYGRQAEAARAHYAQLQQINSQNPRDVLKYAQQGAIAENKINEQRVAAARNANQQIEMSYKTAFESVGSTVSSSLTGIITRTTTWRQLMQNVAKQILSMFVDAGVKMVADWAARQAAQVAITIAGETSKTAAVTTGEAARSGAIGAGAAVQAATVGIGVIKSITASAAETFAGIFGFLSPIMGPAAVGPAAAGEATVLGAKALAGFAVGSWALPGDTIAQVHAGEMIVPAAATPWAQDLMANAVGGGGAGGGDHNHFHFSMLDTRGVIGLFKNNGREMAKVMDDIMRTSPSFRRK